jgi:CheY-like chemotaxis protein/signal transduction histidine kinase
LHFAKACGLVYPTLSAGRSFQLQVFLAVGRTGRRKRRTGGSAAAGNTMKALQTPLDTATAAGAAALDAAMIAHDLRGALAGVLGGVGRIDRAALGPAEREQIERVAASADTLACLLRNLIGEAASPEEIAAHRRIEVHRFLRHLSRRWSGEARERGVRFAIDAGRGLPAVLNADLVSLARALGNLIGNAIRHAWSGEVRLSATVPPEGGILFRVTDEGPGVPPEIVARLMSSDAIEPGAGRSGHGLGLHIVKALCRELDAVFSLSRRSGGGTEAIVRFAADRCVDVDLEAKARPPEPADRPDLAGLKILLAEDNPTNQMVASQMLRALNAEVTLSADGVEALERFETDRFDMLLVDIEMPRLSGLDVIRRIRARGDARASVPIVALTAYAMREHRDRIAEVGANGLISKPITGIDAFGRALLEHIVREPVARVQEPRPDEVTEAPVAPGGVEGPVVDLAIYDALCQAIGADMMEELLEKVVADLLQARTDLAAARDTLAVKPIRSASHILISVGGAIGATRLQGCARRLHTMAQSEGAAGLAETLQECITEIDAAVAFARSRLAAG